LVLKKTAINNVVDPLLSITVFGDPMEISIDVEVISVYDRG